MLGEEENDSDDKETANWDTNPGAKLGREKGWPRLLKA